MTELSCKNQSELGIINPQNKTIPRNKKKTHKIINERHKASTNKDLEIISTASINGKL